MGCFCSKLFDEDPGKPAKSKNFRKPVWKSPDPWTQSELEVFSLPGLAIILDVQTI
jgi:hypothetical protein